MRTALLSIALLAVSSTALAQSAADRLLAANRLLSVGKSEEAVTQLRAAVAAEPGNGRARHGLGSILNSLGYYPEALRHAEAAVAAEPGNGRFRYGLAVVLAEHGRFAEAVENFDRALVAHPDMTYAWLERGAARLSLGDGAGASADWVRARDTATALIWSRWYPATGDFLAGRFAAAANAFEQVAEAEPGFAPARVWAYVARRRAGERATLSKPAAHDWPAAAIEHLAGTMSADQLLALAAQDRKSGDDRRIGEAYFFMGQKALIEGDQETAKSHFQRAIAVDAPRHVWKMAAERELQRLQP